MTIRKDDIGLKRRVPSYVCRETGAAELEISPATWDLWVKTGRLPSSAQGFPASSPRWRWADVDRKLAGKEESDTDEFVARAANLRGHGRGPRRPTAKD